MSAKYSAASECGFAPARFHHHIPHTAVSAPPAVRPSARCRSGSSLLVHNIDSQISPKYAFHYKEREPLMKKARIVLILLLGIRGLVVLW